MTTDDDRQAEGADEPPRELDEGLAFAYGEDARADDPPSDTAPSVLARIGEITGSKPRVLLRDESAGDTPMLKPVGPDDTREAGKYVVHGELGRGGVGAVHRGHDQDLGRDVAMKFLHERYKDDAAILNRFVEEAQIGGQLQHPGIVPVYDLGLVDGKPFFAMKLVKGQTLAKKLAERSSPADHRREFLSIFEDVCQTLAYAHARGVVHRDLKPANIMIGSFGEVQVVDWGLGKVLPSGGLADERLAAVRQADMSVIQTVRSDGHGSQSVIGSVMGTLAYMPPEQARGDVEAMDERSDVFALGAILCEILTGKPPYVGTSEQMIAMASMARLDDAHGRLAACGAEPEMVELATRCLLPAPAARPRSAEVVAKAVHEHLAAVEERVHAARVEAAEAKVRAAALKRTQALGVGLTVVIAAGLLVSLGFWRAADTAATNERLARADAEASAADALEKERLAVEQTGIAQRERDRALEIKALITEMLQSVTPEEAQGADTTLLKGILDTASQRLTSGAVEDELVAAEMHRLTGLVYEKLGYHSEAEEHLPASLEIRRRVLGTEDVFTLASMQSLAKLYLVQGRFAEAEPLALEFLENTERLQGREHFNTLVARDTLAGVYRGQGRTLDAESLYVETYRVARRVLGEEHPSTLMYEQHLAEIYTSLGRHDEAEPLLLHNLETRERVQGRDHVDTLRALQSMAGVYFAQRRYDECRPLLFRSLESLRRVSGEEHRGTLLATDNLALLCMAQGDYDEAEALWGPCLETSTRVLGEAHPLTLGIVSRLGELYGLTERPADAAAMLESCLPRQRRTHGAAHRSTRLSMQRLAQAYEDLGRTDDALPLRRELLELWCADVDHAEASANDLNSLAWALLIHEPEELRDPERALAIAQRACALGEANDDAFLYEMLHTLAVAHHDTGDVAKAVEVLRRAVALTPEDADEGVVARLAEYEAALEGR